MAKPITHSNSGHILTNIGCWSPDSRFVIYDTRSDPHGEVFDGRTIERVDWRTGETETLYESQRGACCGVVTAHPSRDEVVFIHGPEDPDETWSYSAWHRRGALVSSEQPGVAVNLEARDLVAPYTSGALRGGTHVHTFSGADDWVAFTYEDHVLATAASSIGTATSNAEPNQRNIGVSLPTGPVVVPKTHPRNHDGRYFSFLVSDTVANPDPGSDQISRAFSDAWIGTQGYCDSDGNRHSKAIAFLGECRTEQGDAVNELFVVDIGLSVPPMNEPQLLGTETIRPRPPKAVQQRRLTRTEDHSFPGIHGPRHWPRSSADGVWIAFLSRDAQGVVQLWVVSPNGGPVQQVTHHETGIQSAFSWHPQEYSLAYVQDDRIVVTDLLSQASRHVTSRMIEPRINPEACVFSPDGTLIAFTRPVVSQGRIRNQIFVTPSGL